MKVDLFFLIKNFLVRNVSGIEMEKFFGELFGWESECGKGCGSE